MKSIEIPLKSHEIPLKLMKLYSETYVLWCFHVDPIRSEEELLKSQGPVDFWVPGIPGKDVQSWAIGFSSLRGRHSGASGSRLVPAFHRFLSSCLWVGWKHGGPMGTISRWILLAKFQIHWMIVLYLGIHQATPRVDREVHRISVKKIPVLSFWGLL